MQNDLLPAVVIEPAKPAQGSVIWLHGLGADGHDFEPIVPELQLPASLALRFIFPHAPTIPVTINGGYVMRAWYDIASQRIDAQQDADGIHASAKRIGQWIQHELDAGIPANKIVLAGFSQGGVIALQVGLRYPQKLAGILALSCYLPLADTLAKEKSPANAHTEILMAHGNDDPVVPVMLAEQSRDQLRAAGYEIDWHVYPMQHAVSVEEINDISAWLQKVYSK